MSDSIADVARKLHSEAIVIDATCPHMSDPAKWDNWIAGGATVAAPSVAIRNTKADTLKSIAQWNVWLTQNPDKLVPVASVEDIGAAKSQQRLGVLFAFQDTTPLEWDLDNVEGYYASGVRMMGLCYNFRNRVGDGCAEPTDAGLSLFGKAVLREMNRVGMVIDCSHTGYRTTMEAIALATRPPVFSHSNPRKLCDNGRNIGDDQAKAAAEKGGLVGLGGFRAFVSDKRQPTLSDLVDHIQYWVEVVGPDHVGLGLDFFRGLSVTEATYHEWLTRFVWYEPDYPPPPYPHPTGIEDATKLGSITYELVKRGYGRDDILKILGGNWMRVFAANWQ